MVLLIKDGCTKKLKYLKIITDRKAETIILAMKGAGRRSNKYPKIFHSDHGVEYANYKFKKFLTRNKVIQSMSPKETNLQIGLVNSSTLRSKENLFIRGWRDKNLIWSRTNFKRLQKLIS